jgi:hypothetical protein
MVKTFRRIIAREPEERDPTGYFDIYGRIICNLVKYFVCKSTNKIQYICGKFFYFSKPTAYFIGWFIKCVDFKFTEICNARLKRILKCGNKLIKRIVLKIWTRGGDL